MSQRCHNVNRFVQRQSICSADVVSLLEMKVSLTSVGKVVLTWQSDVAATLWQCNNKVVTLQSVLQCLYNVISANILVFFRKLLFAHKRYRNVQTIWKVWAYASLSCRPYKLIYIKYFSVFLTSFFGFLSSCTLLVIITSGVIVKLNI